MITTQTQILERIVAAALAILIALFVLTKLAPAIGVSFEKTSKLIEGAGSEQTVAVKTQ